MRCLRLLSLPALSALLTPFSIFPCSFTGMMGILVNFSTPVCYSQQIAIYLEQVYLKRNYSRNYTAKFLEPIFSTVVESNPRFHWFCLAFSVTGQRNSRHSLNQSEAKLKPLPLGRSRSRQCDCFNSDFQLVLIFFSPLS